MLFNNKLYSLWLSLLVSIGGFVFGFDASVISGAIGAISQQYSLGALEQGLVVGSPTLGAVLAACFVGQLTDTYGRKRILILIAFLYLLSVIGCVFASGYEMLVVFRFIGGLAFASLMVVPVYIAEITPADLRGKYVSFNQLNIVVGFSAAYFSNYWLMSISLQDSSFWGMSNENFDHYLWRIMLGMEFIPALFYFMVLFIIPESPRWLILNNKYSEAKILLQKLVPHNEATEQLSFKHEDMQKISFWKKIKELCGKKWRFVVLIGLVVSIVQQATGVNAIYFYAPTIFEQSGIGKNAAFAQAIWIGIINIIFTLVAIYCIDRIGRKPLMVFGLVGVLVSMAICSYGFSRAEYRLDYQNIKSIVSNDDLSHIESMIGITYTSDVEFKKELKSKIDEKSLNNIESEILKSATKMNATLVLIGILGFVASFAISLGPVMWVILSEIFPNQVRGVGIAFVGVINSVVSFAVQLMFPWQLQNIGASVTFVLYGLFAVLGLIFVIKYLPETKGKTLEQLENLLSKKIVPV